eukprot:GFYU01005876.1.p1 GENE.GFYU01005876.1~~GFYU01005876.1.p1  ORF type:complete len:655 (-),score=133.82 GFYU01005876.1:646-2610(-)
MCRIVKGVGDTMGPMSRSRCSRPSLMYGRYTRTPLHAWSVVVTLGIITSTAQLALPVQATETETVSTCSDFVHCSDVNYRSGVAVTQPASLQGEYEAPWSMYFGIKGFAPVSGPLVLVEISDTCELRAERPELHSTLAGQIVIVEWNLALSSCPFYYGAAKEAVKENVAAVVIISPQLGSPGSPFSDPFVNAEGVTAIGSSTGVDIPVVVMDRDGGLAVVEELRRTNDANAVQVTIRPDSGSWRCLYTSSQYFWYLISFILLFGSGWVCYVVATYQMLHRRHVQKDVTVRSQGPKRHLVQGGALFGFLRLLYMVPEAITPQCNLPVVVTVVLFWVAIALGFNMYVFFGTYFLESLQQSRILSSQFAVSSRRGLKLTKLMNIINSTFIVAMAIIGVVRFYVAPGPIITTVFLYMYALASAVLAMSLLWLGNKVVSAFNHTSTESQEDLLAQKIRKLSIVSIVTSLIWLTLFIWTTTTLAMPRWTNSAWTYLLANGVWRAQEVLLYWTMLLTVAPPEPKQWVVNSPTWSSLREISRKWSVSSRDRGSSSGSRYSQTSLGPKAPAPVHATTVDSDGNGEGDGGMDVELQGRLDGESDDKAYWLTLLLQQGDKFYEARRSFGSQLQQPEAEQPRKSLVGPSRVSSGENGRPSVADYVE